VDDLEVWDDVEPIKCKCGADSWFSSKWDAHFCKDCNKWLEKNECNHSHTYGMGVRECYFECWNRPKKPLQSQSGQHS
jgi:hypothetical protein